MKHGFLINRKTDMPKSAAAVPTVLCIQRQMVVTHIFYFMLFPSSLLSTVISFVYKDKWWFDESISVICMENTWKMNSFIPSPH